MVWDELNIVPPIAPLMSHTAHIIDGKCVIFGGKGEESNSDLFSLDLGNFFFLISLLHIPDAVLVNRGTLEWSIVEVTGEKPSKK